MVLRRASIPPGPPFNLARRVRPTKSLVYRLTCGSGTKTVGDGGKQRPDLCEGLRRALVRRIAEGMPVFSSLDRRRVPDERDIDDVDRFYPRDGVQGKMIIGDCGGFDGIVGDRCVVGAKPAAAVERSGW